MRLYGLLGGQVCIHVQSMWQTWGVGACSPRKFFDFGPFIRHNLVESGTIFTQTYFTIYCAFIIDLHAK